MSDILNDDRLRSNDRRKAEAAKDERPQAGKLSMEERIQRARQGFSAQWNATILPKIENDPDWHYCWLSTTNQYDPIHQRVELGYEPVKPEDMPGYRATTMKSGEFTGCINQNEMVLFRIPKEVYQVAMEEMHHNEPNRLEQSVKEQFDQISQGRDSGGRSLGRDIGDGVNDLGRGPVKTPVFD